MYTRDQLNLCHWLVHLNPCTLRAPIQSLTHLNKSPLLPPPYWSVSWNVRLLVFCDRVKRNLLDIMYTLYSRALCFQMSLFMIYGFFFNDFFLGMRKKCCDWGWKGQGKQNERSGCWGLRSLIVLLGNDIQHNTVGYNATKTEHFSK